MKKTIILVAALAAVSQVQAQESLQSCAAKSASERLACYDALAEQEASVSKVSATRSEWTVRTTVSPVDDSKTVFLQVSGENGITNQYGQSAEMMLTLACRENTTSAYVFFGGHFMSSIQGAGRVTYRIDKQPAQTKNFEESNNHEALGLWSGGSAIPFIKALFGGNTLYLEATPYSENRVSDFFPIAGLEEAIVPLREACNW